MSKPFKNPEQVLSPKVICFVADVWSLVDTAAVITQEWADVGFSNEYLYASVDELIKISDEFECL